MMSESDLEYWLRGPVPGVINLLQPVAHALLQARREINETMTNFPGNLLWQTPAGVASPAFHLQHITGVLDRLFTYAGNKELTEEQLLYLSREGKRDDQITVAFFLQNLNNGVDTAIRFLKAIQPGTLTEIRYVGRKKIPSTQMGLLFHAAEHTMRHTGQLLVTAAILVHQKED